jgi:2-methylisocitrate lyase-like PEP mutase family enzyme
VVVHNYDASITDYAALGVRRCSLGGSLAKIMWDAFDTAARTVKACEP